MDPLTLLATANAAVAAVKKGCELYKQIKGAAGDVKEVLDDLKSQFRKIPNPTNDQKRKYHEEVLRVQEIAKADPHDVFSQIGEELGKLMDAYDAIGKAFIKEEAAAKEVYRGEESIGRRALKRILIRSRLDAMLSEIREQMVYRAPPELGDLWGKFERMWQQIVREQEEAYKNEVRQVRIAAARRRRMMDRMKELAAWAGAVVFVILWMIGVFLLLRMSHTYRSLY